MRIAVLSLAAALTLGGCSHSTMPKTEPSSVQAEARKSLPPPEGAKALSGSLEAFNAACTADLEKARAQVAVLKSLEPATDGRAVLEAYDEATAALSAALNRSSVAREVHPNAAFRDAARACEQQADALNVDISQDRGVYDALSAVDLSQSDAATRYWMERTLLDFRRLGVDRDDATRARVKTLNEEILKLGQGFNQNIAEDVRKVELDPKELAGLPQDFLEAHKPGANGKVVLTSNYPDYFPFMTYARDGKAREKVWRAYR
ncbi:MAG TPA: peptidase M3, partial [Archangium sp.]